MSNTESASLTLAKTRLHLVSDRLVRRSKKGDTVSDIPVSSITEVSLRMVIDKVTLTIGCVLLASAIACRVYITSQAVSWAVAIPLFLCAVLGMFGSYIPVLRLMTRDGEVSFEVSDPRDDAQAFAIALRQRAERSGS